MYLLYYLLVTLLQTVVTSRRGMGEVETHLNLKQFLLLLAFPESLDSIPLLPRVERESCDNGLNDTVFRVHLFVLVGETNATE